MIRVRLREVMKARRKKGHADLTYQTLAKLTGLSRATLEAVGSRPHYNATLQTIDRLCAALECTPSELLEYTPSRIQPRRKRK